MAKVAGIHDLLPLHGFSGLSTLAQCARRYQYAYIDRIEPLAPSDSLHAGSAGHTSLYWLYRSGWDVETAIQELRGAWGIYEPRQKEHLTLGYMETAIRNYAEQYRQRESVIEVIPEQSEQPIEVRGVRGIPDLVGRRMGRIGITEFKLTGWWLGDTINRVQRSYQGKLYLAMLRELGVEAEWYDVVAIYIGKPAKTGVHKAGYSRRESVVDYWDDAMSDEVWEWVEQRYAEIAWRTEANIWPQTDGFARSLCKPCDFDSICQLPPAQRAAEIAAKFREKEDETGRSAVG